MKNLTLLILFIFSLPSFSIDKIDTISPYGISVNVEYDDIFSIRTTNESGDIEAPLKFSSDDINKELVRLGNELSLEIIMPAQISGNMISIDLTPLKANEKFDIDTSDIDADRESINSIINQANKKIAEKDILSCHISNRLTRQSESYNCQFRNLQYYTKGTLLESFVNHIGKASIPNFKEGDKITIEKMESFPEIMISLKYLNTLNQDSDFYELYDMMKRKHLLPKKISTCNSNKTRCRKHDIFLNEFVKEMRQQVLKPFNDDAQILKQLEEKAKSISQIEVKNMFYTDLGSNEIKTSLEYISAYTRLYTQRIKEKVELSEKKYLEKITKLKGSDLGQILNISAREIGKQHLVNDVRESFGEEGTGLGAERTPAIQSVEQN